MASVLMSRVSRRCIKSSLSRCRSIFDPSVSTQSSINLSSTMKYCPSNGPFSPFSQSIPQILNLELCRSVRLHPGFSFVEHLSTSSGVGGDSEEQKDLGGNENDMRFPAASLSWIDTYLPWKIQPYARLARLDKPIGTWLLLWPCMWYESLYWLFPLYLCEGINFIVEVACKL